MAGLEVDIVGIDALDESQWAVWRAMRGANPGLNSPYFHPGFAQVAGRISPDAAVAVFSREGQTVGFFPHQRRGGAMQPLAAPMNDYHGIIAFPGQAPSLEEAARALGATRLNVTAWVGETGLGEDRRTVQVELGDGGYDGWYAGRRATHGKFFKDKERARRSMEAELGPLRVERGLHDPALLDWLIDLKRDQYRRTARHEWYALVVAVFAGGFHAESREFPHDVREGLLVPHGARLAPLHGVVGENKKPFAQIGFGNGRRIATGGSGQRTRAVALLRARNDRQAAQRQRRCREDELAERTRLGHDGTGQEGNHDLTQKNTPSDLSGDSFEHVFRHHFFVGPSTAAGRHGSVTSAGATP